MNYEENVEVDDLEEDEYPAAEVCTKLGPGGPVENIFGAILPTRVTALPKVSFLRSGWDDYTITITISITITITKPSPKSCF